jgi:hypothetical protein
MSPTLTVGTNPPKRCKSDPQIVVVTLKITSVGCSSTGRGTSSTLTLLTPFVNDSFHHFLFVLKFKLKSCFAKNIVKREKQSDNQVTELLTIGKSLNLDRIFTKKKKKFYYMENTILLLGTCSCIGFGIVKPKPLCKIHLQLQLQQINQQKKGLSDLLAKKKRKFEQMKKILCHTR